MFNMSTEDKLKNVRPTFGNTVLPAVPAFEARGACFDWRVRAVLDRAWSTRGRN